MRSVRVQSRLLPREKFSPYEEKNKNIPPKFLPENSFSSAPINFVYSNRGPAIVSDEIMEKPRGVVEGENIKVARKSDCK